MQVWYKNQMGYICKVLRIVTGTPKVLNRCNEDDDNDVDNDREEMWSLLWQHRLVLTSTPVCALEPECPEGVEVIVS